MLQNPSDIQNYNRYSYCLNNPLKYTDPSGYMYENNISNRFRFAHSINRNLEKLLFSNALNAEMWSSGFLGSICATIGLTAGNGLGGFGVEVIGKPKSIEFFGWGTCRSKGMALDVDMDGHFFSNESDAYFYMWKRSLVLRRENMCFITPRGVLVLPCHNSQEYSAINSENNDLPFYYPISWEGDFLWVDPPKSVYPKQLQVIGFLHTHPIDGGHLSSDDKETACYYRGLGFFMMGGWDDISDPRTLQGVYCVTGNRGTPIPGIEKFYMRMLFNGTFSLIDFILNYKNYE